MSRKVSKAADIYKGRRLFELEATLLDEGREDIRAGRCITGEAADAWLDGLDGDQAPSAVALVRPPG